MNPRGAPMEPAGRHCGYLTATDGTRQRYYVRPFKRGASMKKTPARLYTHTTGPLFINGEPTGRMVTSQNEPWKVNGVVVESIQRDVYDQLVSPVVSE